MLETLAAGPVSVLNQAHGVLGIERLDSNWQAHLSVVQSLPYYMPPNFTDDCYDCVVHRGVENVQLELGKLLIMCRGGPLYLPPGETHLCELGANTSATAHLYDSLLIDSLGVIMVRASCLSLMVSSAFTPAHLP